MDNAAADDATLELGLVDNSTAGGMVRVLHLFHWKNGTAKKLSILNENDIIVP